MCTTIRLGLWAVLSMFLLVDCKARDSGEEAASSRHRRTSMPPDASLGVLPADKAPTAYSLIELIARPERYFGTRTVVSGFLVLEKEHEFLGGADGLLYLGREDSVMLLNNWVRVKFGNCRFNRMNEKLLTVADVEQNSNSYVTIRGIFEPPREGAPKPFGGTICAITSVTSIEDPRAPRSESSTRLVPKSGLTSEASRRP